jgi:hypothetical protein
MMQFCCHTSIPNNETRSFREKEGDEEKTETREQGQKPEYPPPTSMLREGASQNWAQARGNVWATISYYSHHSNYGIN